MLIQHPNFLLVVLDFSFTQSKRAQGAGGGMCPGISYNCSNFFRLAVVDDLSIKKEHNELNFQAKISGTEHRCKTLSFTSNTFNELSGVLF